MDISEYVAQLDAEHGILIDGRGQGAAATFGVHNPATGKVVAQVSDGGRLEAEAAVTAAASAFSNWSATEPRVRSEILRRASEAMVSDVERLAELITMENGKNDAEARAEVLQAADFFRWFSREAVRTGGDYGMSPAGGTRTIVKTRPVGVAALVTPWNFPAAMATRKIAPALAAGCTVVLKPAAETPLTALAIARILTEAGLPNGVMNVVPTTDASAIVTTWLEDQRVCKLSFTGPTDGGRKLLGQTADRVLNPSMELGGNAPFVVTADADIEAAVEGAMIAKFRNSGQARTAANRFFVHADVVHEFTSRFGAAIEKVDVAPLISATAVNNIRSLVTDALTEGATIWARSKSPDGGFFHPAMLLAAVKPTMRISQEEIFGPIALLIPWDDEDTLIEQVNSTGFGLAAYLYAGRLQDGLKLAERVDAGIVGMNRGLVSDPAVPFGGLKQSEMGCEGLREYQETQYFTVDWS